MNLYEHTIIARQDTSPSQLKQLQEKYSKIIENNEGDVVKLENWGLMNLSYLIKKNKKGNYIHFKIKANGKILSELEKNEKIDKNLLRFLTVKVKKFDLETNYFNKNDEESKYLKNLKNSLSEREILKKISGIQKSDPLNNFCTSQNLKKII